MKSVKIKINTRAAPGRSLVYNNLSKKFVAYPKLHPFKRQMGNGKREDRLDALRGRERSEQCVSRKNF